MRTGIQMLAAFFCAATCCAFADNIMYTGVWQFVASDGTIITDECVIEMSRDMILFPSAPLDYVAINKATGVLMVWWDGCRKRVCSVYECRDGRRNGYSVSLSPDGALRATGALRDGTYSECVFWHSNAIPAQIDISHGRTNTVVEWDSTGRLRMIFTKDESNSLSRVLRKWNADGTEMKLPIGPTVPLTRGGLTSGQP